MEEKPEKYNRDKALKIEQEIETLSGGYFGETEQEAESIKQEIASIIEQERLRNELLGAVTMMISIYERYLPKQEQKALPAVKYDEDDDDQFMMPPY